MQGSRRAALKLTAERMAKVDQPHQVLGRALTIGCVAVEITQRCNLDCTLCYLSENSEHVTDIPLEEVFRRLDRVRERYGPYTNVQITGGDPTLRKHHELIEIVRYAAALDLFPALFTNGIAATRKLLEQLAAVGLKDVAFHVDTTQQRSDYNDEKALNSLRLEYIERARGLGLMVIFNTTVHAGNMAEIPELVRFFADHAGDVGFASFQLQASTGRGVWGAREQAVSMDKVRRCVETVAGRDLPWDTIRVGHPECHSYLPLFVIGKKLTPVVEDPQLIGDLIRDFAGYHADRREGWQRIIANYGRALLRRPQWFFRAGGFVVKHLWAARGALWKARGRVRQISFFVQNFMDASALDEQRITACSFMVMTHQGPVSMCEHNKQRDDYILQPISFRSRDGSLIEYQPLNAAASEELHA